MSGEEQVWPALEIAPGATLVQRCKSCGGMFASDCEERVCPNCVAWCELFAAHELGPPPGQGRQ